MTQLKYILLTVVTILVSFSFLLCRVSYQASSRCRGGKGKLKGGENGKFIAKETKTTRGSLVGSGRLFDKGVLICSIQISLKISIIFMQFYFYIKRRWYSGKQSCLPSS